MTPSVLDRYPVRSITLSALGVVSWDEQILVDAWPAEGEFSMISGRTSSPGGTTGNLAMTARKLGADVSMFSVVGSDEQGHAILDGLNFAGIDTRHIRRVEGATDVSIVAVSSVTRERTILWQKGPYLRRGDRIDIDDLFGADVVVLDPVDIELRRFLTDLPAHTRPRARIVGPLSYLTDSAPEDMLDIALRHDVIVGNAREFAVLTGEPQPDQALSAIQQRLTGTNCRLAVMTGGPAGSFAVDSSSRWACPAFPVDPVDTTGAGDAFAGAIAFGLAQRWDVTDVLRFASVIASFVVETVGAQAGLPNFAMVTSRLDRWHVDAG